MDIVIIVITFLVMLAGVVGVVVPVLPDVWLIWLAAIGYGLLQEPLFNSWIGGIAMGFLTLLALAGQAADWLGGHAGAAAKGGVAWQSIAASLALGLGGREAARRYFMDKQQSVRDEPERSLWTHL